jgi:putative phage-type endonuclease
VSAALRVVGDDDRASWLEWRRGGLGASDIAAVAGLSPFETPTGVYLKKIGLIADSDDEEWQRIARRLEPVIGELYCDERPGWGVIEPQACVTHPEHPWMRATLDAKAIPPAEERPTDPWAWLPFECKTTTRWNGDWGAEPPDYYQCQGQWQMAVTGTDRAILAALTDLRQFRWWEIPRRQGEIDLLMSIGEAFWHRVLERRPPPVDGSERTNDALREAYADQEREAIDLNAADLVLVHGYRAARDARLAAEKREKKAENAVLALMEGSEEARWQGEVAFRWSRLERTTDDHAAVQPVIDWWYGGTPKKTTPYRRIWLPKVKETV